MNDDEGKYCDVCSSLEQVKTYITQVGDVYDLCPECTTYLKGLVVEVPGKEEKKENL